MGHGELFAQRLNGGPEAKLSDSASGDFAVVENGIYCWTARGSDGRRPLMFFDLSSRTSAVVAPIVADSLANGLAVSPDRKAVLYAVSLTRSRDLKLIERFR